MARQIKVFPYPPPLFNPTILSMRNEWGQRQFLHLVKSPISISKRDKTFNSPAVDVARFSRRLSNPSAQILSYTIEILSLAIVPCRPLPCSFFLWGLFFCIMPYNVGFLLILFFFASWDGLYTCSLLLSMGGAVDDGGS